MTDVKLTHKLRNPKSYNKWMDIWTATVHDPESQGASPKYEITPSENWKIPGERINGNIAVNKIINADVTPTATPENPNPEQEIQKNTSIINPKGNHIAITNTNGSISEGAEIDPNGSETAFLNEKGEFVEEKIYSLGINFTDPGTYSQPLLTLRQNGELQISSIPISGESPIEAFTNSNGDFLKIKIEDLGITSNKIANKAVTPEKIDWDYVNPENSTDTMASKINNAININSSANNGIVLATGGLSAAGKIWSADARGNPGWNDFSKTQWNNATDESLSPSKIDTNLLGAVINTQKPILKFTSEELQMPSDGYYGTNDPTKWKTQSVETLKNIILKQEGNDSLTWRYMIEETTKNWDSEDSQTLGYYHNLQSMYELCSTSKGIHYDLQLKTVANNNATYVTSKSAVWYFDVIKRFRYPVYLVPSVATLDEYFNRINSFIETVTPLIKTSFEEYLTTTLSTKTISEISQIDFQEEMNRIAESITANYPDNWSELVGIRNPNYSPNQLNDWDWKHLGIWIEI